MDLMTTKEEYIDALGRMKQVYYNINGCVSSMNKFKEDIDLLTGLVNEHFEEKAETNYEHFKDEIIQNIKYNLAVVNGEPKPCEDTNCDECDFNNCDCCGEKRFKWLASPYKKPAYKLTKFENDLLQSYLKGHLSGHKFKSILVLNGMKEKGYFKGVDEDATIEDILGNCEVI